MKELIKENKKYFEKLSFLYNDNELKEKIINNIENNSISIISWLIWSWKTSLISDIIKESIYKENYIYFNKEKDFLNEIKSKEDLTLLLYTYTNIYNKAKLIILENINYINIDKEFLEKIIEDDYKIIIIWNDIKIDGVSEIEIFYPSIKKIQEIQKEDFDLNSILYYWSNTYINFIQEKNIKSIFTELLKNEIIYKWIIKNYSIKSHNMYKYTITFIALYNWYISLREINKKLNLFVNIWLASSNEYIDFSIEAKIIRKMPVFDIKKNKIISTRVKYYFWDIGLRNNISWYNTNPISIKENVIFNEFIIKWYSILWWLYNNFNFSFIASKKNYEWIEYIKYFIYISKAKDNKNLESEIKNMKKIKVDNTRSINYKIIIIDDYKNFVIQKQLYEDIDIKELKDFIFSI